MADLDRGALEMLKTALSIEEKGEEFYRKAMESSKNDLGKKIFETLMKDEKVHYERILKIYKELRDELAWSSKWKSMVVGHKDVNHLFREMVAEHGKTLEADPGELEALDLGIDFEYKTLKFYQDYLPKAVDPLEKEFLEKMVAEERGHYTALKDMKYFMSDPATWYQEMERSGLDGA